MPDQQARIYVRLETGRAKRQNDIPRAHSNGEAKYSGISMTNSWELQRGFTSWHWILHRQHRITITDEKVNP
jgi:hypothetical protein